MGLLNNPWVIGVATGIIAWAVTWGISRLLLSKKEDREYAQKIATSNREVIIAIRPGIAEGQIPSREILEAMVKATARRYGVTTSDMYNAEELSQELIKEVMDSSFLSSAQKAEYCAKLLPVKTAIDTVTADAVLVRRQDDTSRTAARYRSRMVEMLSLMMSLSVGLMTALLAFREFRGRVSGNVENIRMVATLLIPIGVTLVMVVAMTAYRDMRSIQDRQRELKEDQKKLNEIQDELKKIRDGQA